MFLCDDDPDYRFLIRAVLEPAGNMIVGEAHSARTCLQTVAATSPDVVLVDHVMPEMRGLEAVPLIRQCVPDATVIMLSSAPAEELRDRALAAGAHAFLTKPKDIWALPRVIDEALVGRRNG